jgi:putative Flp pilus-assembly TadE/G-like protein
MRETGRPRCPERERRRALRRTERQHALARIRARKGQSIIIFALTITVLLGFAGLAIDVARAYDLYGRMQRAADAGAMAGVLYMPAYYSSPRTPGDGFTAISRTSQETVKNGFGAAMPPTTTAAVACNPSAEVSICQVTNRPSDLRVTITETLNLALLSSLGLQPVRLVASGQAEYLPPVQIGARLNYIGDQVECFNSTTSPSLTATHSCSLTAGGNLQEFLVSLNGPAELKEQGDPFVYCEEGSSISTTLDGSASSFTTYNGDATNHPQFTDSITNHCGQPVAGGNPGNSDQQPGGYAGAATTGTAHPGGYNYGISIPSSIGGATLWVFNPSYIVGASQPYDQFLGTGNPAYFKGPNGEGLKAPPLGPSALNTMDAPLFYFNTTFTLYKVNSLYDRTTDTQVGTPQVYPPYDAQSSDVNAHGCSAGTATAVYDPYYQGGTTPNAYFGTIVPGQGCFQLTPGTTGSAPSWRTGAPAPCWAAWCQLPFSLNSGTYRLVVEATGLAASTTSYNSGLTDGWGAHGYALKVCASLTTSGTPISCSNGASGTNPGVTIAGWNNEDTIFLSQTIQTSADPTNPATSCALSYDGTHPYACMDLGCIPSQYAGRAVDVRLFDPGDGGGDIFLGVVQAGKGSAGVTYNFVPAANQTTADGETVVHTRFTSPTNFNAFNGLWLDATISLPPSYVGDCLANGTGWWQMIYIGNNPHDKIAVTFSLVGSPVHLVQLG